MPRAFCEALLAQGDGPAGWYLVRALRRPGGSRLDLVGRPQARRTRAKAAVAEIMPAPSAGACDLDREVERGEELFDLVTVGRGGSRRFLQRAGAGSSRRSRRATVRKRSGRDVSAALPHATARAPCYAAHGAAFGIAEGPRRPARPGFQQRCAVEELPAGGLEVCPRRGGARSPRARRRTCSPRLETAARRSSSHQPARTPRGRRSDRSSVTSPPSSASGPRESRARGSCRPGEQRV